MLLIERAAADRLLLLLLLFLLLLLRNQRLNGRLDALDRIVRKVRVDSRAQILEEVVYLLLRDGGRRQQVSTMRLVVLGKSRVAGW